ncbi:hypothetical protein B0H12DRAFT_1255501 [Mycena haematopus]|nr:hypothetical protein B0H12DRAFT_1255501 [Mycena haematopus]
MQRLVKLLLPLFLFPLHSSLICPLLSASHSAKGLSETRPIFTSTFPDNDIITIHDLSFELTESTDENYPAKTSKASAPSAISKTSAPHPLLPPKPPHPPPAAMYRRATPSTSVGSNSSCPGIVQPKAGPSRCPPDEPSVLACASPDVFSSSFSAPSPATLQSSASGRRATYPASPGPAPVLYTLGECPELSALRGVHDPAQPAAPHVEPPAQWWFRVGAQRLK